MTREEAYVRVNKVFRETFEDDSIVVEDKTTSAGIAGWDSLEHIDLMVAIETEFGMNFTMAEITEMKNVGEMVDIILSRVN